MTINIKFEHRHEKTCLRYFRVGQTQTSPLSYRDYLESWKFEFSKYIRIINVLPRKRTTKALIRLRGCAGWSAPLLFTYGKNRFPNDVTHLWFTIQLFKPNWFSLKTTLFQEKKKENELQYSKSYKMMCGQWRISSECADTESSLPSWRSFGSLAINTKRTLVRFTRVILYVLLCSCSKYLFLRATTAPHFRSQGRQSPAGNKMFFKTTIIILSFRTYMPWQTV